jgi:hypothetical protein
MTPGYSKASLAVIRYPPGVLHTGGRGRDLVLAPAIFQRADGDPVLARGEIVEAAGTVSRFSAET